MRKTIWSSTLVLLLVAAAAVAQVSEGDQHWAVRAEGHQGGHAQPAHVDVAIAAYQRAVAQNPNDLEARWKLLRAIRFKGAYVATTNDQKKQIYTTGKKAGEETLAILDKALVAKGVKSVVKATEKQVADAARSIPGAGEIFLWDAVNWGEWALAYGKMAAVREGAADRIKREATIAMLIDPKLEGGTPARVLGRLHDQTPRVPFITGWASSKEAVRLLNESLKIDPANKITKVFLAEAMVSNDRDQKPAAITILRAVVNGPNDPEFEVEQAAAADDARALLKKWGA
jgi:tetratricopeptide (TPR) repeat protein